MVKASSLFLWHMPYVKRRLHAWYPSIFPHMTHPLRGLIRGSLSGITYVFEFCAQEVSQKLLPENRAVGNT